MKQYIPALQFNEFINMIEKNCNIKLQDVKGQAILRGADTYILITTISADVILNDALLEEIATVIKTDMSIKPVLISIMRQKQFVFENLKVIPADNNFNAFATGLSMRKEKKIVKDFLKQLDILIHNKIKNILEYYNFPSISHN